MLQVAAWMKASLWRRLTLFGLIAGLFVGACGFLAGAANDRLGWAMAWGPLGIGAGTCVVTGLHLVSKVRSRQLSKAFGIVLLLVSSVVTIVLPPLLLILLRICAQKLAPDMRFLQGEGGMWVLMASVIMFWIAVGALVAFAICLFFPSKRIRQLED